MKQYLFFFLCVVNVILALVSIVRGAPDHESSAYLALAGVFAIMMR